MDFVPPLVLLLLLLLLLRVLTSILAPRSENLPPGPPSLRIITNILSLRSSPHQTLAKLSNIYGPLMHLKLGTITTIIASSPDLAKQVLGKHDHLLSGRFTQIISRYGRHHELSIVLLPPSNRWRALRRICKEQMISMMQARDIRQDKLNKMRDYVQECCDCGRVLDVSDAAFVTLQNVLSETMFSKDLGELMEEDSGREFKMSLQGLLQVSGTANVADYLPFLEGIDPQGLNRRAKGYFRSLFGIFDDIIDERVIRSGIDSKDVLQALLEMKKLTRNEIKHLFLDLFLAGVDTTATTIEWAMAELIRNPEKMGKARKEVNSIAELEISKLPYLEAVVKETLRLHPPGPFLLPHKAEADTQINGYIVPKNSQVLVNVWAIGRDSSIWSNPDSFEPERFLDRKFDVRGQDFELIPFGSGRRICPGLSLGYLMVHLVVATLIRSFDWKLANEGECDMEEKFEFTVKKAQPLKAVPLPTRL